MSYELRNSLKTLKQTDVTAGVARVRPVVISAANGAPFHRSLKLSFVFSSAAAAILLAGSLGSFLTVRSEPGEALFSVRAAAEDTWYSATSQADITVAMWSE